MSLLNKMRLQLFLARAGLASRRKAEELIKEGRVSVNGLVVNQMGLKVDSTDKIEVDGTKIELEKAKVYIMLNKPYGVVSTSKDQFNRPSVVDYFKDIKQRVYPVGRLDYDTTGLILLTNDGDFTYKLTHPSCNIDKIYEVVVKDVPNKQEIIMFEKGLKIENYLTHPAKLDIISKDKNSSTLHITIHEGRNRQVRKMLDAIGHPVISLKRIAIGGLYIGDLKEGEWRYLSEDEKRSIK